MLRSRCSGARSINVACARLTNAPLAGFPITRAGKGPEADRCSRQHGRERERETTCHHHRASPRRVAENADQRVERTAEESGNREHEPDLRVREVEVVADQRPGGRACATDELVEQLDREQQDDDAGSSAPAKAAKLTRRSSAVHGRNLTLQTHRAESVKSLRPRCAIWRALSANSSLVAIPARFRTTLRRTPRR